MILRVPNWNRRNSLCKDYGFRAAIVYRQEPGVAACDHRLKAKEFLYRRYGKPMCQNYSKIWINTNADWFAARTNDTEYTIAVKDARIRNWLLLL
jgi:hypothetical protein